MTMMTGKQSEPGKFNNKNWLRKKEKNQCNATIAENGNKLGKYAIRR